MHRGVESLPNCPVCRSPQFTLYYAGRDVQLETSRQQFKMSRCRGCRAMFLSERCPEGRIHEFYGTAYQPYRGDSRQAADDDYPFSRLRFGGLIRASQWVGLERAFRRGLEELNRYAYQVGSGSLRKRLARAYDPGWPGDVCVDYGCGNAAWLNSARTAGWETIGVDFTPTIVDRVRSAGHRAVLVSETPSLPEESVGLVRMNHVVEHLYRPREVLVQLHAKLRTGGLLHLATPNPDGLGRLLFGRYWPGLDIPRHVILFPPRLLARFLSEIGYSSVEVFMEPVVKDLVRSMGFLEAERGKGSATDVVGKPYDALYSNLLAWPVAIIGRFGLADQYHIVAQK